MNYDGKTAMPYFGSSTEIAGTLHYLETIGISKIIDNEYRNFSICIIAFNL